MQLLKVCLLPLLLAHGEEFSCLGQDSLLSVVSDVPGEQECRAVCGDTEGCVLYTWELYQPSSTYCLLYSHCELVTPGCPCAHCTTCSSGLTSNLPCTAPQAPQLGQWSCSSSLLALTCSLECGPGLVPGPRAMTTCVGGVWSTPPSSLECHPGRILVTGGYDATSPTSAEIYGDCSNISLPNLPDYRFYHTLDYVDGQVIKGETVQRTFSNTRCYCVGVSL